MSVSTASRKARMPVSAWRRRRLPSKKKGLVTTPTVSAPIDLAIWAMTGAAPVPVPPPMPAVTKTMSAPSSAAAICSRSSSAALRPTSGLAPAPSPLVSDLADLDLERREVVVERLRVGVGGDELHPVDVRLDHRVDGVAATAADADHLDECIVRGNLIQLDHRSLRAVRGAHPGSVVSARSISVLV